LKTEQFSVLQNKIKNYLFIYLFVKTDHRFIKNAKIIFSIVFGLVGAKTRLKKTVFAFSYQKTKQKYLYFFWKTETAVLSWKKTKTEPTFKFPYRHITNISVHRRVTSVDNYEPVCSNTRHTVSD